MEEELEVDWGTDEPVDVWRQSAGPAEGPVGEDDDAISLDGLDGGGTETEAAATLSASPRRTSSSKPPPTGPRKPIQQPSGPNVSQTGSAPTGPRRGPDEHQIAAKSGSRPSSRNADAASSPASSAGAKTGKAPPSGPSGLAGKIRNTVENQGEQVTPEQASSSDQASHQSKPVVDAPEAGLAAPSTNGTSDKASVKATQNGPPTTVKAEFEPLLEGWTEVVSRSQGQVFYHNKATGETSWTRPVKPKQKETGTGDKATRPSTPDLKAPSGSGSNAKQIDTPAQSSRTEPVSSDQREPPRAPSTEVKSASAANSDRSGSVAREASLDPAKIAEKTLQQAPSGRLSFNPGLNGRRERTEGAGFKRSISPRRDDSKRFRPNDGARAPPSGPNTLRDRPTASLSHGSAPSGPRGYGDSRPPRSPPRSYPPRDVDRRETGRPSDLREPSRNPPPSVAQGSNGAPISGSRWGSRPASDAPASRPDARYDRDGRPDLTARQPSSSSAGKVDAAAEARAKLREEARKAEETLRKIKEEEARLEKEEAEKKRREDLDKQRRLDDQAREDEVRRRREDERRRDDDRRRPDDRDAFRVRNDRAGSDRPSPGGDRRPPSPARLRYEDRSYRPSDGSPPRGPPPASRLDGPGPPPMIRDARNTRPRSPDRIARRDIPPSMMDPRGPPIRPSGRPVSPPRAGGDSFRPAYERDRPGLPLIERMGRSGSTRDPVLYPEPMRPRPNSPPPAVRGEPYRSREGPPRSLAERMAPQVDNRNRRDYIPR